MPRHVARKRDTVRHFERDSPRQRFPRILVAPPCARPVGQRGHVREPVTDGAIGLETYVPIRVRELLREPAESTGSTRTGAAAASIDSSGPLHHDDIGGAVEFEDVESALELARGKPKARVNVQPEVGVLEFELSTAEVGLYPRIEQVGHGNIDGEPRPPGEEIGGFAAFGRTGGELGMETASKPHLRAAGGDIHLSLQGLRPAHRKKQGGTGYTGSDQRSETPRQWKAIMWVRTAGHTHCTKDESQ